MKHGERIYDVVHSEEVLTDAGKVIVRVCAITDPEKYRIAKLENRMPVKVEKKVKGNKYEVIQKCESISTAQNMLPDFIRDIKTEVEVLPRQCVTIFDI